MSNVNFRFADADEDGVIIFSTFKGAEAGIGMPKSLAIYLGAHGAELIKGEPVHVYSHSEMVHGQVHPLAAMFGQVEYIAADSARAYEVDTSLIPNIPEEVAEEGLWIKLSVVGDYTCVSMSGPEATERLESGEGYSSGAFILTADLDAFFQALGEVYA